MRIADETFFWEAGQSRVFDDTNEHEVWNDSGEERVVLFLQFHRPFRAPGRLVSELFLKGLARTPYLTVPLANVKVWDAQFAKLVEERGILPGD